jgi:hypothetical protein
MEDAKQSKKEIHSSNNDCTQAYDAVPPWAMYAVYPSEDKTNSENHGYSTDCTDLARIGQSVLIRAKSVL